MKPYHLDVNVVNEFSNILILDDPQFNMTNIFDAIKEGRLVYDNLKKCIV